MLHFAVESGFPNSEVIVKLINQDLGRFALRDCLPKDSPGHVYGWVGTAFDYRARYCFKVSPYKELMAYQGGKNFKKNKNFWKELNAWVRKNTKKKLKLTKSAERDLCVLSLLLAKLEVVGRSPGFINTSEILGEEHYRIVKKALVAPTIKKTIEILKGDYPASVVKDLMQLSGLFKRSMKEVPVQYSILNPYFSGNYDVGGADADIIINRALIDFKCKKKKIGSNELFQLIGYKLLDYGNWYKIEQLGIYFGRQGQLRVWNFKDVLTGLGCPTKSIQELRRHFREAADEDMAEKHGYF